MRQSQTIPLKTSFPPYRASMADRMAEQGSNGGVELSDILAILGRRIFTILVVLALFLLPAIVYILTAPTLFSATTSILVDSRQGRSLSIDTVFNLSADTSQLESQLKLVMSQTVLRRVVEIEKLLNDEEFGAAKPGLVQRILSVIRRAPPEITQQDKLDSAVDALAKNMSVRRSERTYVIDIQVSSQDAQKSARLANAVAKAYLDDASDARSDVVRLEGDYVRDQLADLRGKMQEAEQRVAIFKEKNRIFDASGKLVNDEQINGLSTEIVQARAKTAEARARFEQVQRALRTGKNIETLADAPRFPVLERLRTQSAEIARAEANLRVTLGPRHPQLLEVQQQAADTRRLIMEELRRVANASENEFQVAKNSEASLEAELNRLRAIAGTTNLALPQLRELERDVDAQRAAFDKLSKAGDTISQQGADTPVARIIAVALVPVSPSSPRRIPILALAATAGICFGIGAALLGENLSRRKRNASSDPTYRFEAPVPPDLDAKREPAGTQKRSSLPVRLGAALARWRQRLRSDGSLKAASARSAADRKVQAGKAEPGDALVIPAFEKARIRSPYTAALDDPGSAFAAAIRALALAQLRTSPHVDTALVETAPGGPKFIFVTSIERGVGKSVIVSNLAHVAAAAGARILIIDTNLENPTLSMSAADHGALGMIPAMGRLRPAFLLDESGDGHLFLLSASEGDTGTAERLAQTLPQLLTGDIDQNFDLVLIDGGAIHSNDGGRAFSASADQIMLVGANDVADPASLLMAAQALDCEPAKIEPVAVLRAGTHPAG